jgi:hypothetical protein
VNSVEPAASSSWQLLFLSFAAVVVLLEMVRGWRLGLMRQLVRLLAVVAAYGCAVWGGAAIVPGLRGVFKMPDALLSMIGGAILAFVAYAVITTLGTVLFKRTTQHQLGIVRAVWGATGAILGIFFGIFVVWLLFAGIRLVGSVAAAQVRRQETAANKMMMPAWRRPLHIKGKSDSAEVTSSGLATTLSRMKISLEGGVIGGALQQMDPLPPATYRTLEKLGAVAGNVESAERFLSFPGAREIGENPKVLALRNDPEIADLIAHRRIFELLQNKRLVEAANDPTLRRQVSRFNLEGALDYAMQKH